MIKLKLRRCDSCPTLNIAENCVQEDIYSVSRDINYRPIDSAQLFRCACVAEMLLCIQALLFL